METFRYRPKLQTDRPLELETPQMVDLDQSHLPDRLRRQGHLPMEIVSVGSPSLETETD